jgi:phytoene/squalene synthetase
MDSAHLGRAFHGGEHYENFPVGSWLVPKPMRGPVLALYRFARTGDDIADEGAAPRHERHHGLGMLRAGLESPPQPGLPGEPNPKPPLPPNDARLWRIGQSLGSALNERALSALPAHDLLDAFAQDVDHTPMQSEHDVLDYCARSANPVGRLVLGFAGLPDDPSKHQEMLQASDAICTGLQLANFAQDMGQDQARGRHYAPHAWHSEAQDPKDLVSRMAQWARHHLNAGVALPALIRKSSVVGRWRLAMEIALTIEGGLEISRRVLADPTRVWHASPRISSVLLPVLLLRAFKRI